MSLLRSLFLVLVTLSTGCFLGNSEPSGLLGHAAPFTRFTSLDGTYRTLEEFRGRPLVVMFWAEYCSFSKPEIEELNELAADLKKSSQALFLAVSLDDASRYEAVRERVVHRNLDQLEHAFSGNGTDDEAYLLFHANDLPHFYVIAPDGVIVAEGHSARSVRKAFENGLRRPEVSSEVAK
jgi:thiol-disulfide isomerase/thioredoxin